MGLFSSERKLVLKSLQPEKVVRTSTHRINSFMALRHNTVKIPGTNQLAGRDTVLHAPDVVMLVINNHQQMVLEKQWRDSVNQFTYEIPAGKIDSRDHHNPRHAAVARDTPFWFGRL